MTMHGKGTSIQQEPEKRIEVDLEWFVLDRMLLGLQLVIPKVRYSEGSVNPKVRYSKGSLFRRFVIPKVRYSEGPLFRRFVDTNMK